MNDNLDFEKIYHEKYKKLPTTVFRIVLILVILGGILIGVVLSASDEDYLLSIPVFSLIVSPIIAAIFRYITSICISQKIALIDAVIKLKQLSNAKDETINNG